MRAFSSQGVLARKLRALAALLLSKSNSLTPLFPPMTLIALLGIVFAVRCHTAAQYLDMGNDIANYLSTMNTLFGADVTGVGLNRPPLIGLALKPFTMVLGDVNGAKVLGILLSVALGIPFYLLARRLCHQWIAVATSMLFVLTPAYSDMLSWGYLTMFGLFFIMLTLHCLLLLLEKPSALNIALTGVFASLIVGFHQLSLAFFVPLILLLFIALLVFERPLLLKRRVPLIGAVIVAVVLSIPYVPIYLRLLRIQAPATSHTPISLTSLTQIKDSLFIETGLSHLPWLLALVILLVAAPLTIRWTWQQKKSMAVMFAVMLLYSLVLVLFAFPAPFTELNSRAHYFMYIPVWLFGGLLLTRLWSWHMSPHRQILSLLPRLCVLIIVIVLLSGSTIISVRYLKSSLDFYSYLDKDRWRAITYIRGETPREAVIVAYPEMLGWWIEAEARRSTLNITDRDTAPLTYLKERSLAAERALSRNRGIENGNLRLSTTDPYNIAPGTPVLAACIGGFYRDVIMFDDRQTYLQQEGGHDTALGTDPQKKTNISGDSGSRTMTTSYNIENTELIQTATLDRGSLTTVISYRIQGDGITPRQLRIPIYFAYEPESGVSVQVDDRTIDLIQVFSDQKSPLVMRITIETEGGSFKVTHYTDHLGINFNTPSREATITFNFTIAEPDTRSKAEVTYYELPQIITQYEIAYLAVDFKPNPNLISKVPVGTKDWLDRCPYYSLVYSDNDIRIYRVNLANVYP